MSTSTKSTGFPVESLEFSLCPTEEKFEETLRNTHLEWGKAFSLEMWIANNKWLVRHMDYAKAHRHKLWIVTSREDPSRSVLCSGGYFERRALLACKKKREKRAAQGLAEEGGKEDEEVETTVKETKTAHVAMVCTAEQHRGHGYAGWMMRQIWAFFEQQPEFPFTYLYSAVGDMYVRMGWRRFPADTLDIPAHYSLFPVEKNGSDREVGVHPYRMSSVTDENLDEMMRWDATLIREELAQKIDEAPVETTVVALLPDPSCIRWHRARSRFYFEEHRRQVHPSQHLMQLGNFGASLDISGTTPITATTRTCQADRSDSIGYILWSHDFRNNQLILFRLRYEVPATAATVKGNSDDHIKHNVSLSHRQVAMVLIDKAIQEARRWGFPKVVIWSPSPQLVEWLGLECHARSQYLPCLGVSLHPDTPASERPPSRKVEWVLNELYAY
ncbi:hypothetical protein BGZ73_002590 [Actinomortierella ambigua]|nr:hypothetical protein BGZ73_002590 [Actinomortierella ambigua]